MENIILPEIRQTDYAGQKVLSTIQLSVLLKCKRNNITDNFRNHKAEFVKGVDYFHVAGDELNALRQADKAAQNGLCAFSKYSTNTYLWTESGVEKLTKIIGTDAAKFIYASLKFGYFQPQKNFSPTLTDNFEKLKLLEKWIDICKDENLRDDLIRIALNLLK